MPLLGNAYLASYREQLLEDIMAAKTGKSFVIHEYAGLLLWVARMGVGCKSKFSEIRG
jgi:hypothetical protein